ncbi:MAG: type II toxin-antitoxin system YafQ family toxin [Candidatus Paceibacterota bacterium]|jgi:mRNA interferase YafQ
MYQVVFSSQYQKSLKKISRSGNFPIKEIEKVISLLIVGEILPYKYKDHKLNGELSDYRECHIKGDLLLIYKIEEQNLILVLINIGSHSKLF